MHTCLSLSLFGRAIFDELLEEADVNVAAKLVPVLLERSTLLLGVPSYKQSVNR